ncbi:8-hydroxy-dADP phosphatase [Balamuthia mandrillaris]
MEGEGDQQAPRRPTTAKLRLLFLAGGQSNGLKGEASSLLAAMEGLAHFKVEHAADLATALKKLNEKKTKKKNSQKKDKKKKKTKTTREGEEEKFADALPYYSVVVTKLGGRSDGSDAGLPLVAAARQADKRTFIAVHSWTAANSAHTRLSCFDKGANMVTASSSDLLSTLTTIAAQGTNNNNETVYQCPTCGLENLTAFQLYAHHPLYHVNEPNTPTVCPLCTNEGDKKKKWSRFPVHLFNEHAPPGAHTEDTTESLIYAFALVVCQRRSDGRFLLVQEFCNTGFWLPAGRVDAGEKLGEAAIRETKEEAGIDIELTGVLRIEWSPGRTLKRDDQAYVRMRVVFYGHPKDETQLPKSIPNYESVGAVWATLEDVTQENGLPLRGREPREWFEYIAKGGAIYPMSLIAEEGSRPAGS